MSTRRLLEGTALGLTLLLPLDRGSAQTAPAVSEIVVTGTRVADRTAADSLAPIEVVGSADLASTGRPGLLQELSDLVPSFNLPAIAGEDASAAVRYGELRGLSPDQTLVLVDGKRRHNSAIVNISGDIGNGSDPVDLDYIPADAIDHIEILRDGAAAQYGSDAIAGVINIILKKDTEGRDVSFLYGEYGAGDGATEQGQVSGGAQIGNGGHLRLTFEGRNQDPTSRDQIDPNVGRITEKYDGLPGSRVFNFVVNADLPIDAATSLYGFATYGHRDAFTYQNFREPFDVNTVPALFPNGFEPILTVGEDDFSVTGGIRGTVAAWDWDLSTTYGRDIARFGVENSDNPTLGAASPTSFHNGDQIFGQWTTTLDLGRDLPLPVIGRNGHLAAGLEFRQETFQTLAGDPASYENGGVIVTDGEGDIDQPGSQSFGGLQPKDTTDVSRTVEAGYLDYEAEPVRTLQIGLAGRFEHYSDFGDTISGKASARWQIIPELAWRGTLSNGFRAPGLAQEYYRSSSTNIIDGQAFNIEFLPPNSSAARALGAEPLKPELSTNYSTGFVFQPAPNFTTTLDGYQIDIKDRILLSSQILSIYSNLTNAQFVDLLQSLGVDGVNGFQYYTNAATTRTRGLDLVTTYRLDAGDLGTFAFTEGLDLNHTQIRSLKATPAQLLAIGEPLFDFNRQGSLTTGNPQTKLMLSVDWQQGPWAVTGRETRYGHTAEYDFSYPADNNYFGARWITDLQVQYAVTPSVKVAVGSNNLFDVYPDKRNPATSAFVDGQGGGIYSGTSPFGISGGFYYVRTDVAF